MPILLSDMSDLAAEAEAFETPEWAVRAILRVELLTPHVIDPGCGRGVLAEAAKAAGYYAYAFDLHDWGYGEAGRDFLDLKISWVHQVMMGWDSRCRPDVDLFEASALMNPPFSKACRWVEHARHRLGLRKVVCFQRLAWWEGQRREAFWRRNPPQRVYVCAKRASCWRIDVPLERRQGSGTPTAHAWFVWERGQPGGPVLGRLLDDG